ncbi:type VI secretion system lipoprotein TssJ [Paraburkholderia agricolaris]|uniref:type VI secretion system lipoprotein TssJ n=1 Tax=Paraburkholderia agricolaris TaxID=2152888 RepID=UPI001291DB8E|nr:type VI secretion system lipoprotein TssJ [Paraburkholderia agricolaris]
MTRLHSPRAAAIRRVTQGVLRWPGLVLPAVLLAGCGTVNGMLGGNSGTDALAKLKWSYAADAIHIAWQADPRLNEADGQPHALSLVAVQMTDASAFAPYAASPARLAQLLSASMPPAGLLSLRAFFVQPGENGSIVLPRVESAQYVGIAAGYYDMDSARVTRLYRIGVDVATSGWVVKHREAAPVPLQISLQLGRSGFVGSEQAGVPASAPLRTPPRAGEIPVPAELPRGTGNDAGTPATNDEVGPAAQPAAQSAIPPAG